MANTILTATAVTRKALAVLHQKLNFIGSINRQYDSSFANDGANIGDSLKIRLPNEYVVRNTMAMAGTIPDIVEQSTTLAVSNVMGVDMNFSSTDLTLHIDDFSDRIIEPAMSVLAANLEAAALNMALDVYQAVDNVGSAITMAKTLAARKKLVDALAPGSSRSLLLNTQDNLDLVDALKGLFQDSTEISKQYREGKVGRTAGFGDIYENTLLGSQTTGSAAATTGHTVTTAVTANGSAGFVIAGVTKTWKKGDVFTVAGCNRVHPETKADTGALQQFVVTADSAGASGDTLAFSPAIYTTTGRQNVTAGGLPVSAAIVKLGAANGVYKPSLAYHKDAFTFATADLVTPKGVDFAAREVYDGISMSLVRAFSIADRSFPCRLDVLYGYKTIRPALACRILSN